MDFTPLERVTGPGEKLGQQSVDEHGPGPGYACENCGHLTARPLTVTQGEQIRVFCCMQCLARSFEVSGGVDPVRKMLVGRRSELISKIEGKRGFKLITMIHREEMGTAKPYITIEDSEEVLHELQVTADDAPVDFVLHCPGGIIMPAEQIALAVKDHPAGVSVIVPHYAMSGATLIALAAKEILMDPYSVLGPLDTQIQGFPSPSLIRLLQLKKPEYIRDEMLILADIAVKSLGQMKAFIVGLLWDRFGREKATALAEFFTGGYLTHDSPITAKAAQALGLPVKVGLPEEVHELMRLYKPTSEHRGSWYDVPCGR